MALVALLTALSTILYHLKFNLPVLFPGFLEFQFSNLPVVIGGFALGPISGVVIVVLRTLIKLPFTTTSGVGELADFIIGISVVLPSSLYYRYHKSKEGGIIALLIASLAWIASGLLSNYLITMPFYIHIYSLDAILPMLEMIPGVTAENYMVKYLLYAILPFNLLLSILVNIVTYITYKRISNLFKDFEYSHKRENTDQR